MGTGKNMVVKAKYSNRLPTTFVWELDDVFRNWAFSVSRMLQLLVVQRQARIDDDGSLCVLWSSQVGVSLIGLERIPNLYEREKHSLYDPVKI